MLHLQAVTHRRILRDFLDLPEAVHSDPDTPWVAPLRLHVRQMMGRLVEPGKRFLVAYRGDRPVARLGARVHGTALHFGFFECLEGEPEAARELVAAARALAPNLPLRGPFHFEMEDPYAGILVEGFDEDPYLLCPWNPPYYDGYLQEAGLRPAMDLYRYRYDRGQVAEDRMETRAARARARGVTVRTMNPWRRFSELNALFRLVNRTHRRNWGFDEYSEATMRELTLLAAFMLDPKGVFLAHHMGELVGCAVVLRNLNPLFKPARGRLTPRLLWDLLTKAKTMDTYRGYGLGILEEWRHLDTAAALVQAVADARHAYPWQTVEISWVVATNAPMNALARALGGVRNKVHRVYEGEVEPADGE